MPALAVDDGTILTENTAILQFVAWKFPEAQLAPVSGLELARLQQWLAFITTELHKTIFGPLLDSRSSDSVKEYSRSKIPTRFALLQDHLAEREFLLDRFSIADAYLATVLNWCTAAAIDLKQWLAVHAYHQRILQRPSVTRAFGEELTLYKEEKIRQAS